MSKPFFIWTMQRTGGSSFAGLLMTISEYPHIVHEPFNTGRIYDYITEKYKHGENITTDLDNIFQDKPNIKHCYELFDKTYNALIMDASIASGYQHIFLCRRDETSRILSRFLAMQTGVWGPKEVDRYQEVISGKFALQPFDTDAMLSHYKHCKEMTEYIQHKLEEKQIQYKVVNFEDLYVGNRNDRLKKVYEIFQFLEFDSDTPSRFADEIEKRIFHAAQNSHDIVRYVPNYIEAKNILDNITHAPVHNNNTSSGQLRFISKYITLIKKLFGNKTK